MLLRGPNFFLATNLALVQAIEKMNSKGNFIVHTEVPFFIPVLLIYLHLKSCINHGKGLMLVFFLQGTEIIDESHDQDTTDLHKCVTYIRDLTPKIDGSEVS